MPDAALEQSNVCLWPPLDAQFGDTDRNDR